MEFDAKFKALRAQFKAEGFVFPSLRAFHELVKDDYVERVEVYGDYVYYELRHRNWVLSFVDCYTVGVLTNIMLIKDDDTVVFYSGQE